MRRCRVCRSSHPKAELLRWTVRHGSLVPDPEARQPGRGYYSCSERCAEIITKTVKVPAN